MGVFSWGPIIQSTDTFNSLIGAITSVSFADFSTVFDWMWSNGCNSAILGINNNGYDTTTKGKFIQRVSTGIFPKGSIAKQAIIDKVTSEGENINDYLILKLFVGLDGNAGTSTDPNTSGSINIRLIHKDDFLVLCNRYSTRTMNTLRYQQNPDYYMFRVDRNISNITFSHKSFITNTYNPFSYRASDTAVYNAVYNGISVRTENNATIYYDDYYILSNHTEKSTLYSSSQYSFDTVVTCGSYGSSIKGIYDDGGTNEDEENSGATDGTWGLTHTGEKSGHSSYNDLEASLFRVYALNKTQMSDLAQSIWNPNVLQAVLQKIGGIEKLVIGLYSYPFAVQHESSVININFNWLDSWADGVQAKGYRVTEEYQEIDFGDISIPIYSGTFYDYQPFSSVQLFIPYIGFVPLKMNEIQSTKPGCSLNLKFNINVTTGDFCAMVTVKNKYDPQMKVYYDMTIGMYNGNISRPLPLSRQEMFEVYKAGATLLSATAMTAMGARSAMIAQSSMEGAIHRFAEKTNEVNSINEFNSWGDFGIELQGVPKAPNIREYKDTVNSGKRQAINSGSNAISAVTQANAPIDRSGNLGGVIGRCAEQKAFILITYPHQNISKKQSILGYSTNAEGPLSKGFEGYTEVREIRIKNSIATSSEIAEIEQIVRGGIII